MMNSDSAFFIGKSHKICQDYSLYKDSLGLSYAMVSDGCSASKDVDFGCRLLSKCAEKNISLMLNDWDSLRFELTSVKDAFLLSDSLNIEQSSLDATLLVAAVKDDKVYLRASGDGAFILRKVNGDFLVINIVYPRGYPCYPSYLLNKDGFDKLLLHFTERFCDDYKYRVNIELYDFSLKDSTLILNETREANAAIDYKWSLSYKDIFDSKQYDLVLVMSDGIHTFFHKNNIISFEYVLSNLLGFKNYRGEFVQRRFQGFLRVCGQEGWDHDDDISFAGIHLGE